MTCAPFTITEHHGHSWIVRDGRRVRVASPEEVLLWQKLLTTQAERDSQPGWDTRAAMFDALVAVALGKDADAEDAEALRADFAEIAREAWQAMAARHPNGFVCMVDDQAAEDEALEL